MNLSAYPRPATDTGLGFHYAPRRTPGSQEELDRWLPHLHSLGASWLVVRSGLDRPLPEAFIRQLIEAGIEPVVMIPVRPIRAIPAEQLRPLVHIYREYGVRYLTVFHQPNRLEEWAANEWAQPDLVGRFMRLWTPVAYDIASIGMIPVFPALIPGGHYWDTAFLAGALEDVLGGQERALLDRLAIGMQNLAFNRPLNWGQGGLAVWRDARPYAVSAESQDQRGFRLFDWYDEVVRKAIGFPLPLVGIASGAVLGARDDSRYSAVDVAAHAERNAEMARQMVAGELPESVLNLGFWTLTGGGSPGAEATAWFRVDGQYLPAVDLVRQLPRGKRPSHAKKAVEARLERRPKPLHHYLLFGTAGDAINAAEWKAAGDYVRRYRPTCGFSLDEAVQAEYVTIVGGLSSISREQEQVLRDAGCQVERIGSESTRDTAKAFKMLVKANRRFKGF